MRRHFQDKKVTFKKLSQWGSEDAFFTDSIIGLGDNELQSPDDLLEMAANLDDDDETTLDRLFHLIEYMNDVVYVMQDIKSNAYFYCTRMGIRMVKINCDRHPEELRFRLFDNENGETIVEFNGGLGNLTYVLRGTLIARNIPLDTSIDENGRGLACGIQMDANDILNLYNAKPAPKSQLIVITASYAMVEANKFKSIEDVLMEQASKIGKEDIFSNPEAFTNMLQDIVKTMQEDENSKEDK